jgi:CheY-like chemotaxis protein
MSPPTLELKRILVVDDDIGMTTLCRRFLQQSGRYVVREENSGARAVATAREFRPHLIYLDRRMPGLSGAEIVAELRADLELSAIPIVYITGMVETSGTLEGLPVLAKPIRGADLVRNADEMTAERE